MLAHYRLLRSLVSGKRILDLDPGASLGQALLAESGNRVDLGRGEGSYDLILALDRFRDGQAVTGTLNGLRDRLGAGGVFAVSSRVAPQTGLHDESGEFAFRLETLAKLLQDYFRVVTYAFLHGEEFRAEWDQYSDRVVFFCRFLKATQLPESGEFLEALDTFYGGTIKGLVPFSLPYVRAWLNRDIQSGQRGQKGNLLFFLQPLPLYGDPLLYQTFFERYYLLGEEYRDLAWNVYYATTSEVKSLYGAEHTFAPEDFRHPPHLRDWRVVYAKTLDNTIPLDDPDIAYWAGYIDFLLDSTQPAAIFVWNKNALLDRVAARRGILVIHNEVCLDRSPRPRTYFFDPDGVNAESALRTLWDRFRAAEFPACCEDLVSLFRRTYVDPWLGSPSRAEVLHSLGLDASKKTLLVPLQVENDSNVLRNSPFESMSRFCERILSALPRNRYNVIVKPHPADPLRTKLAPSVASRARILDGGRAMGPLLQVSDCVFTISSTTGYEALLASKPVVTFGRSVYSHMGFTVDLEAPAKKARIEPPLAAPPEEELDRFILLASMFYPISERTMWSAKLQEPLLERALECRRRNAKTFEYWADPSGIDWERFCFDKMAEWLDAPRSLGGYAAPAPPERVAGETLIDSLSALEQEHAATLAASARERDEHAAVIEQERAAHLATLEQDRAAHLAAIEQARAANAAIVGELTAGLNHEQERLAAARAEISRLDSAVRDQKSEHSSEIESLCEKHAADLKALRDARDTLSRAHEKLSLRLREEQEKTRQFQELQRESGSLRKSTALLRAELVREKRQAAAARKTGEELQGALAGLRAAARTLEERLKETAEAANRERRRLSAQLDGVSHNNAHLRKQLDAETDKCRLLEAEVSISRARSAELEGSVENLRGRIQYLEGRLLANRFKRGLHRVLDVIQSLIPEKLRRAVRPIYLGQIYYRIYPEKRPAAALVKRPGGALSRAAAGNHAVTSSSYRPYVEFKQSLYGGLPLDFRGLSVPCTERLVSVVLPVYNGARYVAASIESVLHQTYRNVELIIVDDGSTDETPRILEAYRDEPMVRIIQQRNQKLPAALNHGFARATGEYWTWTSDDNVMLPGMLAELVAFLEEHADAEMVYADQEVIDEAGQPLLGSDYCPGYQTPPGGSLICWPRDPGELNFVQNNYFGGCFLYRAWAALLAGHYSASNFGFEDYDYWMRMNALFRVKHFGQRKALYRYRVHRESLSARDRELQITERVRAFMTFESSRRNFFDERFDITLFGAHIWFAEMAAAYREAGHNVFEAREWSSETRYRYEVTRAFRKRIAVFGENCPKDAVDVAASAGSVALQLSPPSGETVECAIASAGTTSQPLRLRATSARAILYPVLAGANSILQSQSSEDRLRRAALQHA